MHAFYVYRIEGSVILRFGLVAVGSGSVKFSVHGLGTVLEAENESVVEWPRQSEQHAVTVIRHTDAGTFAGSYKGSSTRIRMIKQC